MRRQIGINKASVNPWSSIISLHESKYNMVTKNANAILSPSRVKIVSKFWKTIVIFIMDWIKTLLLIVYSVLDTIL